MSTTHKITPSFFFYPSFTSSAVQFCKELQEEKNLFLKFQATIEALKKLFQKIEATEGYDKITHGKALKKVSSSLVFLSVQDIAESLKSLARLGFYEERKWVVQKKCQGHEEFWKSISPKDYEVEKIELCKEFLKRPGIRFYEISFYDDRGLLFQNRRNINVTYFYRDNYPSCSCPSLNDLESKKRNFVSVLEEFESFLKGHHLNQKEEWLKLGKLVYGVNLVTY